VTFEIIIGREDKDKKELSNKATIFLGKHYVQMGNVVSLSNRVLLDVAKPHVILLAGKRGCLHGDTMIFTGKGYKKIKNFNQSQDKIFSFNKDTKKFEWENATLLRYPIKNEDLLKFELSDGREIIVTQEHPLLTSDGTNILWKNANEFEVNDQVVLASTLPEVNNVSKGNSISRLLGYTLADGNINIRKGVFKDSRGYFYNGTKSRIRIYNADSEVLEQAEQDFEIEFNIRPTRYSRNDCNCEVIQVENQKVVNNFIDLGVPSGNKSEIIRIPNIVFESSNTFKANFINALFCCDGSIHKTGRQIEYASKSKEFLLDLQLLLTHFGIESTIRPKIAKLNGNLFTNYRLHITDNTSVENFKKIGFIINKKQQRLNLHMSNGTKRRKTHYIGDNLVCKRIRKISFVSGLSEVYDLSVPKNHSFIANGIISHNSGKSHSLGVMAEEMANLPEEISKNLSIIIFDTMGIFWTSKYENTQDEQLLKKWEIKPNKLNVTIFAPQGFYKEYKENNIPVDKQFTITTSDLEVSDWCNIFEVSLISEIGILIDKAISILKKQDFNFTIDDIIEEVKKQKDFSKDIINAVENRFNSAKSFGIFSENGISLQQLTMPGKVSIIDLSCYTNFTGSWNVKGLVISIISKKLLIERINKRKLEEVNLIESSQLFSKPNENEMPLVWLLIDEASEYLPKKGKSAASDALIQILREGRQPGISLVLATQQPGEIHNDVLTQSDIVISHRVTAKRDIEALNSIMQSYLYADVLKYLNKLPNLKGSAIVLDDNSERIYPIQVRPRFSWHGGSSPSAIKKEKALFSI